MKISVITVCYNSATTLKDTLESVLQQTYPELEYILIDGASSDGTLELIQQYAPLFNGRMKWISELDQGIYDAMNKGIRMSTGDIIGFLNADDYYYNDQVLEHIADAFKAHPNVDAIHGNLHYINVQGKIVRTWTGSSYHSGAFQQGWNPAHPTFYCHKSCFERYGAFNSLIGSAADFELMLRFIEKHHITTYYINRFIIFMRTGGSSTAGFKAVLRNTRQNKRAFTLNGIHYPWHYDLTRLIRKITALKNPLKYFNILK